ncbi:hypothetical protein [Vibrio sp. D431a]|uniref:hypothetical protein n=1 Tax=Vibrio sp. D431a TaxID=2837388 RepID=UPI00255642C9|nr:hypothetical protein [Vibrio sp. D431a]MDK9793327.1 hypothetical protein [Vibrio sp. D431a]
MHNFTLSTPISIDPQDPNASSSEFEQLQLLFILLNRMNFKADYEVIQFLSRCKETIIEQGNGFGNSVSIQLQNNELNLNLNLTYVGRHYVPDIRDVPKHFVVQLETYCSTNQTTKRALSSMDNVIELVKTHAADIVLKKEFKVTGSVVGFTEGKTYEGKIASFNGFSLGYYKAKNDKGETNLIPIDYIEIIQ